MAIMFKPTKQLEAQIEEFLTAVSEGALVFEQGVKNYLENDQENFQANLEKITTLEHTADNLRRQVENMLYTHTLIPEHRGDVLGLLENTDDVIDTIKETLEQFDVERPDIPEVLNKSFLDLMATAKNAAEELVKANRAFFIQAWAVKEHLHKILFYEKESDRLGTNLMKKIFEMDMDLSQKTHLRDFVKHIDNVSDRAEAVADRLAIYSIKRKI